MGHQEDLRRQGVIFCLIGPAGGGKTTVAERLLAEFSPKLSCSVSVTSRAPRAGEVDGESYHFVPRERFQEMVQAGEFFEWEEVHGNLYGTLRSTVQDALASGRDLLLDVDIRGALNFKRAFSRNTVIVFVVPPSFAQLKERLERRPGTNPEDLARRIGTARGEYAMLFSLAGGTEIDYFLVNEEIERTYASVRALLLAERMRLSRLDAAELRRICALDDTE